jgi:protein-S-isoprenylcysteine O-methyltransferase Ste14
MNLIELALLLVGTGALLVVSWRVSLKAGRLHGIYRFFSFESILILGLLNWRYWFVDPFSEHQILSWILLVGSIFPAVLGYRTLQAFGQPQKQFENTQSLVRNGIYRYIRHPMYLSLMLLGTGVCLKDPSSISVVLGVINIGALVATALKEETEMLGKFGSDYMTYMNQSKMFIPYVI